jgi:hypothetical protein
MSHRIFRAARAIKLACLAELRETSLKANHGNHRIQPLLSVNICAICVTLKKYLHILRDNNSKFLIFMNRTYRKSELAALADVSYSTFYRYLCTCRDELSKLGSSIKAQTLRGEALEYVCRNYNITLPPDEPEPPKKHQKFV